VLSISKLKGQNKLTHKSQTTNGTNANVKYVLKVVHRTQLEYSKPYCGVAEKAICIVDRYPSFSGRTPKVSEHERANSVRRQTARKKKELE
jgi:hypothetical protein